MSDYDCTNCAWDINEFGDIKCLNKSNMINSDTTDASNLDPTISNICDPRCYKFNDKYLKDNYYNNVYNKILTGLSNTSDGEVSTIRNELRSNNDMYSQEISDVNSSDAQALITRVIIEDNDEANSNCTNPNLLATVNQEIRNTQEKAPNQILKFNLPSVDTSQLNNIIDRTNRDIGEVIIDETYDKSKIYSNLLPNANNWPCKDSNGSDVTTIDNTEFTSDYTNICNPNASFSSIEDIKNDIDRKCNPETNAKYQNDKAACDNLTRLPPDDLKKEIRKTTLKSLLNLKPKYIKSDDVTNIAYEEVINYFRHMDTSYAEGGDSPPEIPPEAEYSLNAPTSEEFRSLSDILSDNYRFRNCIDEILYTGDNDGDMINKIKTTELKNYEDSDFEYISRKIDRLISIRPSDLDACFSLINNVDDYICQGVISTSVFNIVNMVVSLFGIKTDIYKLDENPEDYENFKKLLDIVIPKVPVFIKRLLDLARHFETTKCGGKITSTTLILEKINNDMISKKIDVNYNLFDNYKIDSFFDDFTKNIYGKIVLLIFISFLISKIL